MMIIGRIFDVMKCRKPEDNLSWDDWAAAIDVSKKVFNRMLKGQKTLPSKLIEQIISDCPGVSARWLITGEGNMLSGFAERDAVMGRDSSAALREELAAAHEAIALLKSQLADRDQTIALLERTDPDA